VEGLASCPCQNTLNGTVVRSKCTFWLPLHCLWFADSSCNLGWKRTVVPRAVSFSTLDTHG